MNNKLYMKYPTSWHGDMWREGSPCGSGMVGALVYGGVAKERIMLTHALLWNNDKVNPLPDISDVLPAFRKGFDQGKYEEFQNIFTETAYARGGTENLDYPIPVCDILIETPIPNTVKNYSREIDMENGYVDVKWNSGDDCLRRTFVSRKNDCVYTYITSADFSITLTEHDPETQGKYQFVHLEKSAEENALFFFAENGTKKDYGAVAKIVTNGKTAVKEGKLFVSEATETVIAVRIFVETKREKAKKAAEKFFEKPIDFSKELAAHARKHKSLYNRCKLTLSNIRKEKTNEILLYEAADGECSNELCEKLWKFGHYLFISATREDAPPCHLTGLWTGSYSCTWAMNMFNVNFEMIYWQALQNGLDEMLLAAFDYIENLMDDFRENARKIFGCGGILINSVNTPASGIYRCFYQHIISWTGAAGWICQHYYDYYLYTGNREFLEKRALPFMYETAQFYEDFITYDENGKVQFYPSNSPENVPASFTEQGIYGATQINATMDFAILHELLTNLLKGSEITGFYKEKQHLWKTILSKIPTYQVNKEGGICEWMHKDLTDQEAHRHHSHLYPLFPGTEITPEHPLFENFKRANELRIEKGLSEHSSWGMMYAAGCDARLGEGNKALEKIGIVAQNCIMNNLFTLHNDWRRLGPVMCYDLRSAPFQIDGNMGMTAVVNEMLLTTRENELILLPALPDKWKSGKIEGLKAKGNFTVSIQWADGEAHSTVKANNGGSVTVRYGNQEKKIALKKGEAEAFCWKIVSDGDCCHEKEE